MILYGFNGSGSAASGAGQHRADGLTSPRCSSLVTSCTPDRPRAVRPAGTPATRAVLAGGDVHTEDLPAPVGVHPGRDQAVHVHRPAALADLLGQRVDQQNVYGPPSSGRVRNALHQLVQLRRHLADLRLGQAR